MDPEHGMREEVFAKFGDEKGLAIMIKPFQVAKRDLGHPPEQISQAVRKGSFCELLNNHREVRTVG
jgi:hypothetical protein